MYLTSSKNFYETKLTLFTDLQSVDSRREAKPKKAVTQVTNTTTPIDPQAKTTIAKAETIVPFPHTDPKEESAKTQPREKATKNPDPKTPSPKKRRRAKKAAKKMAKTRCADMGSDKSVEKGANQDVEMDINKGTEKGPEMMIIERL